MMCFRQKVVESLWLSQGHDAVNNIQFDFHADRDNAADMNRYMITTLQSGFGVCKSGKIWRQFDKYSVWFNASYNAANSFSCMELFGILKPTSE